MVFPSLQTFPYTAAVTDASCSSPLVSEELPDRALAVASNSQRCLPVLSEKKELIDSIFFLSDQDSSSSTEGFTDSKDSLGGLPLNNLADIWSRKTILPYGQEPPH